MPNKGIDSIFVNTKPNKNSGDYASNPLNIFNLSTWNKPRNGTENNGILKQNKEQSLD